MEQSTPAVVALVNDLIFASRIRGTGAAVDVAVHTVRSAEALMEACRTTRPALIVVDLETRSADIAELIERLGGAEETRSVPVIAFGSHVNREAIEAAREAGADRVLARSAFVRELPRLLRRASVGRERERKSVERDAPRGGAGGD